MSEPQYEFNEPQNQIISGLSQKMKFVSIFLIVVGLLQALGGVLSMVSAQSVSGLVEGLIGGIIYIFVGVWGAGAANSFQQVVDTEGNDIDHMMSALGDLKKAATLTYWLLIIFIILLVAGVIIAIMAGAASPS
ncbi:MAG: hypothetical protein DRR19_05660 [Candidatus Parabeggiatoa sp. nov. 1]|nr:MAG: hypothetical protein DRR19_05660 [Gammaproteobacteria bacterium]